MNESWVLSDAFSASVEIMLKWFLFFLLLMWSVTVTDWYMLNHPCDPEMNPASSRCMIFFFFYSLLFFSFSCFKIYIILLKYNWLTVFQVHSRVIQLYTYIIFETIFHHKLLQDTDYSSLWFEVTDGPALQLLDGPALELSDGPVLQLHYSSVLFRK